MKRLSKSQKLFRGGMALAIMVVALVTAVFAASDPKYSSAYPTDDKGTDYVPHIKIVCETRGHEHPELVLEPV